MPIDQFSQAVLPVDNAPRSVGGRRVRGSWYAFWVADIVGTLAFANDSESTNVLKVIVSSTLDLRKVAALVGTEQWSNRSSGI